MVVTGVFTGDSAASAGSSSKITYSGYNRRIVSVSPEGVVTAVGVGTTKVIARTYNKKKAKITVVVKRAPRWMKLKTNALSLGVGGNYAMKWTLPKKAASVIQIASDNPGVVAVNDKGVMTAADAIEFLMAGATAIEIGTANFLDPAVTVKVAQGINAYLDRHGFKSVKDIIGICE